MKNELNKIIESGKLTIFEIPVIDTRTKEKEFILCSIDADKYHLFCTHIGINKAEENSEFVSRTSIIFDLDVFSIDENLQELYSEVVEKICNSDIYTLAE